MILPEYKPVFPTTEGLSKDTRVAIIAIHGWSPKALMGKWRTEESSDTMAKGMATAVRNHLGIGDSEKGGNITEIPLKGHGTIMERVDNFAKQIQWKNEWRDAIKNAELLFVVGHSQGSPTCAILLQHIIDLEIVNPNETKTCLLLMAGINEGPSYRFEGFGFFGWLAKLFGEASTHELFEFRKFQSPISVTLRSAYETILQRGIKVVKLAAANDEVVPIHSALFASVEHPSILRGIYVINNDQAFLANFSGLLIEARNRGYNDHGLLTYVGEPVIDAFSDFNGHCLIINEEDAYSRAFKFLCQSESTSIVPRFNPFDHSIAKVITGYIPWAMRGLIDDGHMATEIKRIRVLYREWNPYVWKNNALLLKLALQVFGDPSEDWVFDDSAPINEKSIID